MCSVKIKLGLYPPCFFLKWHKKNEKGRKSEEKMGKMRENGREWVPLKHGLNPCRGRVVGMDEKVRR